MPFKKGAAVRPVSSTSGMKVVEIKEPEKIGDVPLYCVEWTNADGEAVHRWFTEEELEAAGK